MAVLQSQVIIPYFTNLPKDVITNTMYWETDDLVPPEEEAEGIAPRLTVFYQDCMDVRAANHVAWALTRIKVYNLADPEPRAPILDDAMPITLTPSPSSIPTEVAVVMSYHAAPISGTNPGRLRGRIYLGGFSSNVMSPGSASSFPQITPQTLTDVANAAEALLSDNSTGLQWKQLSRASGLAVTSDIVGGWVDNTPDTQRRRGVDATARTVWP